MKPNPPKGPSTHLSWAELGCWNRTGKEWKGHAPGELIAAYPEEWRFTPAIDLAVTFEEIRAALGNAPIHINSAYRTVWYNRTIGGARNSQHTLGKALDIRHSQLSARAVHDALRTLTAVGELPLLGGLGLYPTFVHIDVRPRPHADRLAVWTGKGEAT